MVGLIESIIIIVIGIILYAISTRLPSPISTVAYWIGILLIIVGIILLVLGLLGYALVLGGILLI